MGHICTGVSHERHDSCGSILASAKVIALPQVPEPRRTPFRQSGEGARHRLNGAQSQREKFGFGRPFCALNLAFFVDCPQISVENRRVVLHITFPLIKRR